MDLLFSNLVAMQQECCLKYASNNLFGTKVADKYKWIKYQAFAQKVDEYRAIISSLDISSGDKVAIISNNRVEWAIIAYATLGLEATFVPMYLDQHEQDWSYILNDCKASLVFVSKQESYEKLIRVKDTLDHVKHIVTLDNLSESPLNLSDLEKQSHPAIPALTSQSDETCFIVYTSGTTGKPKGVMLNHKHILFEIKSGLAKLNLTPKDVSLSFLPWAHIFGHVTEVHAILFSGMSTAIVNSPNDIAVDLTIVKPTVIYAVPRIYSRIYSNIIDKINTKPHWVRYIFNQGIKNQQKKTRNENLSIVEKTLLGLAKKMIFNKITSQLGGNIRIAISGASELAAQACQLLTDIGIPVYQGYGLTETTSAITVNTKAHNKIGSVGRPITGCRIAINSNDSQDKSGEIICYGGNIMLGYYKNPEATNKVLTADGGFKTGDTGFLDEDGYLHITGRIKDQFKLANGKFVAPSPLEEKIQLHPLFEHALLYGANKEHVIAILVIDPHKLKKVAKKQKIYGDLNHICKHTKVMSAVKKILCAQLKGHKSYAIPKEVIISTADWTVSNNLLTPTLKIKRNNIEQNFQEEIDRLYNLEPASQVSKNIS